MEIWDLYTKDREKTSRTVERGNAIPDGYYRVVIHVCIFNSRGEMLIQHRQPFKNGWSGMWDLTVGGHAVSGDTSSEAAHRELMEELGLDLPFDDLRPALTINFEDGFDDVYLINRDVDTTELKLQYEEVAEVKWASLGEILRLSDSGKFIPYHKSFITLLFFLKDNEDVHTDTDHTTPIA